MFTIHLHKLAFFAHHGLHDEEAVTGTNFEIDADVQIDMSGKITSIHQTLNYTAVYDVIKKNMEHPVALLETLAQQMAEEIYSLDNRIKVINIRINKLHPPIKNFMGAVGVSYTKVF